MSCCFLFFFFLISSDLHCNFFRTDQGNSPFFFVVTMGRIHRSIFNGVFWRMGNRYFGDYGSHLWKVEGELGETRDFECECEIYGEKGTVISHFLKQFHFPGDSNIIHCPFFVFYILDWVFKISINFILKKKMPPSGKQLRTGRPGIDAAGVWIRVDNKQRVHPVTFGMMKLQLWWTVVDTEQNSSTYSKQLVYNSSRKIQYCGKWLCWSIKVGQVFPSLKQSWLEVSGHLGHLET